MRITCVVDDAVERTSPFWGEHGLAFLIESDGRRLLFDTGQSGTILLHNLELLGKNPATIDALAISHGHHDHTGGLPALLEHLRPGTGLHANPDVLRERFSERRGKPESIGPPVSREALAARLALRLHAWPQEILPGVWTTGEILERPEAEGRSDHHLLRVGEALVPDTYRDDMALVLERNDKLMLLCGCCHAGLLNTLAHVHRSFSQLVAIVAGGLHLTGTTDDELRRIGQLLASMPALQRVCPNHCTGEAAFVALTQMQGSSVVRPCPAGTVLEF